ncbi:hypothetical protein [Sporosarcina sp. Te-1]|uniref:hypothetical protein n=1 Tax=Sporosarcina sp. Te-1 TaxID=2818390 RepID=UPI001A9ED212|nr:hypothetical protein [Sporosarcina sp. Te-1]QTD41327.1 hypothetical protein J3U78_00175 [Sporosarcina sp. Te-1]
MDRHTIQKKIIELYQEDEMVMIRLFIQWCQKNGLDPRILYSKAYPEQNGNEVLNQLLASEENHDDIIVGNETMLDLLQLFGNDDLAFVVAEEVEKLQK